MGRLVDVDELVGAGEIADLLGFSHAASIHNLVRRHVDFPAPVASVGRAQVWAWSDVRTWAVATGRLPDEP